MASATKGTDKSASVLRSSLMPAIGLCSYSDLRAPPGVGGLLHRIAIASHAVSTGTPACLSLSPALAL
jgi:hypothetical protein